ncbi:hypothetical protein ISCGN_007193 [Ixodes scapularis]
MATGSAFAAHYYDGLTGQERSRYDSKIAMRGIDPFTLKPKDMRKDWKLWPELNIGDITDYLVTKTSYVTRKETKAYKAQLPNKRVNHSQSRSAPTLKAWLLMKTDALAATDARYSDLYVPKTSSTACHLLQLYDQSARDLTWEELQDKTARMADLLEMDNSTIAAIEQRTRLQSESRSWLKHRGGRITASNLQSVCHTSLEDPSRSLLKRICYPEKKRFSAPATRYDIENEPKAIDAYTALATAAHDGVTFRRPGLIIAQGRPSLAATPDLLVDCSCCGKGVVEVKCPYKLRNAPLKSVAKDKGSCITLTDDGDLALKEAHPYYYQVQLQMFVCDVEYADFVLWNSQIDVQRILRSNTFLCAVIDHAARLFTTVVLPELVAKWFTSTPAVQQQDYGALASTAAVSHQPNSDPKYCVCGGPEEGSMIACDNENCTIGWFHFKCVGVKKASRKKTWFCTRYKNETQKK